MAEPISQQQLEEWVLQGDYHVALQALGRPEFTPGDGSWPEWIFRQMHRFHYYGDKGEGVMIQPIAYQPLDRFLQKVALNKLTYEDHARCWSCYVHLSQLHKRPISPVVYHTSFFDASPYDLALALARRGDDEGLEIMIHHFGHLLPKWHLLDQLPVTVPAYVYARFVLEDPQLEDEWLDQHARTRFECAGQLEDWSTLMEQHRPESVLIKGWNALLQGADEPTLEQPNQQERDGGGVQLTADDRGKIENLANGEAVENQFNGLPNNGKQHVVVENGVMNGVESAKDSAHDDLVPALVEEDAETPTGGEGSDDISGPVREGVEISVSEDSPDAGGSAVSPDKTEPQQQDDEDRSLVSQSAELVENTSSNSMSYSDSERSSEKDASLQHMADNEVSVEGENGAANSECSPPSEAIQENGTANSECSPVTEAMKPTDNGVQFLEDTATSCGGELPTSDDKLEPKGIVEVPPQPIELSCNGLSAAIATPIPIEYEADELDLALDVNVSLSSTAKKLDLGLAVDDTQTEGPACKTPATTLPAKGTADRTPKSLRRDLSECMNMLETLNEELASQSLEAEHKTRVQGVLKDLQKRLRRMKKRHAKRQGKEPPVAQAVDPPQSGESRSEGEEHAEKEINGTHVGPQSPTKEGSVQEVAHLTNEIERLESLLRQHQSLEVSNGKTSAGQAGQETKELIAGEVAKPEPDTQSVMNKIKEMENDHELLRRADKARIRYLEQMLKGREELLMSPASSARSESSDFSPTTSLFSPFRTPARRTMGQESPMIPSGSSDDQQVHELAMALECSERQRGQALEDLQMEREFYAEKIRSLQLAFRKMVGKKPKKKKSQKNL